MAVTAFGLHGSGEYDYYGNVTGAALVTQHIVTLQGTPVDFCIFYKFDGGNCADEDAPCLVQAESGELKPNAEPFALHSRLLAAAGARLAAELDACGSGGVALAAYSAATTRRSRFCSAAPARSRRGTGRAQRAVRRRGRRRRAHDRVRRRGRGRRWRHLRDDGGGLLLGQVLLRGGRVRRRAELPIEVDANNDCFSALLTLVCASRRRALVRDTRARLRRAAAYLQLPAYAP